MNAIQEAISELRETKHIPEVTKVPKSTKRLARKASEILGYEELLQTVGSGVLQHTLESLGIEVLDKAAVYKYQKKFGMPILNAKGTIRIGSSTVSGFLVDAKFKDDDTDLEVEGNQVRPGGRSWSARDIWARTGIREYQQMVENPAIPEFALSLATQVKEELPEANVYVEHLVHQPDPFLVVAMDGEEFYLEVWEEPGFEATMEKQPATTESRRRAVSSSRRSRVSR